MKSIKKKLITITKKLISEGEDIKQTRNTQ
jgi:hypothetical protein